MKTKRNTNGATRRDLFTDFQRKERKPAPTRRRKLDEASDGDTCLSDIESGKRCDLYAMEFDSLDDSDYDILFADHGIDPDVATSNLLESIQPQRAVAGSSGFRSLVRAAAVFVLGVGLGAFGAIQLCLSGNLVLSPQESIESEVSFVLPDGEEGTLEIVPNDSAVKLAITQRDEQGKLLRTSLGAADSLASVRYSAQDQVLEVPTISWLLGEEPRCVSWNATSTSFVGRQKCPTDLAAKVRSKAVKAKQKVE